MRVIVTSLVLSPLLVTLVAGACTDFSFKKQRCLDENNWLNGVCVFDDVTKECTGVEPVTEAPVVPCPSDLKKGKCNKRDECFYHAGAKECRERAGTEAPATDAPLVTPCPSALKKDKCKKREKCFYHAASKECREKATDGAATDAPVSPCPSDLNKKKCNKRDLCEFNSGECKEKAEPATDAPAANPCPSSLKKSKCTKREQCFYHVASKACKQKRATGECAEGNQNAFGPICCKPVCTGMMGCTACDGATCADGSDMPKCDETAPMTEAPATEAPATDAPAPAANPCPSALKKDKCKKREKCFYHAASKECRQKAAPATDAPATSSPAAPVAAACPVSLAKMKCKKRDACVWSAQAKECHDKPVLDIFTSTDPCMTKGKNACQADSDCKYWPAYEMCTLEDPDCNQHRFCQGHVDDPILDCVPREFCEANDPHSTYNEDYHKPMASQGGIYALAHEDVDCAGGVPNLIPSTLLQENNNKVDYVVCRAECHKHPQCGRFMWAAESALCNNNPSKCQSEQDKRDCRLLPFEWCDESDHCHEECNTYVTGGGYDLFFWNFVVLPEDDFSDVDLTPTARPAHIPQVEWDRYFERCSNRTPDLSPCFQAREDKARCNAMMEEHFCYYHEPTGACGKVARMVGMGHALMYNSVENCDDAMANTCGLVSILNAVPCDVNNNWETNGQPMYTCGGGNKKKKKKGGRRLGMNLRGEDLVYVGKDATTGVDVYDVRQ